jgi:hypothetical protein
MKHFLFLMLILAVTACADRQQSSRVEIPEGTDVRADLSARTSESGEREILVNFYLWKPDAPGVKTVTPRQHIAVAEPALNGETMTEVPSGEGPKTYRIRASGKTDVEVSARINGQVHRGTAKFETYSENKSMTVTLVPIR